MLSFKSSNGPSNFSSVTLLNTKVNLGIDGNEKVDELASSAPSKNYVTFPFRKISIVNSSWS